MRLRYLTNDSYDQLLSEMDNNKCRYLSGSNFMPEFFNGNEKYFEESSALEVSRVKLESIPNWEMTDEDKSVQDLANTRLIYDGFKKLSPLQATNRCMWTYLCHDDYIEYIRNRWLPRTVDNLDVSTIRTRFFVEKNGNLLNDNAISRFWWYGHLTYDSAAADHYHLTKILFTNQTIATDVMDTFNRMNPERIRGVLMAIELFKEDLPGDGRGITEYFRECKKFLNHYGAVTLLDFLTAEEIKDLAYDYMKRLYDSHEPIGRRKRLLMRK